MTQNFSNHRHTPALFIAAAFFTVAAAVFLGIQIVWGGHIIPVLACLVVAVGCVASIGRRYVTKLQDRIIKLEMRVRTDRTLTPEQCAGLWKLRNPQIIALRFASDAEMPALIDRAAKENLSATDIKKAVKDWQPDFDRT